MSKEFSAVIPCGNITCIKGASGCGKTTLLKMISGLDAPDSGTIKNVPDKISFVFQEDRLCEDHTPVGNIKMVTGKALSKDAIVSHLAELGLEYDGFDHLFCLLCTFAVDSGDEYRSVILDIDLCA